MNEPTICHATNAIFPAELSANGSGCLVRIYPTTGPGGLWELNLNELRIGRSTECEIELLDDAVSRRHAAVHRVGNDFVLIDLHSTNGTFVNDRRVSQHLLQAGDQVHVGGHILKFLSQDGIERQYFETVYVMTTTDGLTGAYTKQYLRESLQRELVRARRHQRVVSLLMIDLDHFKRVNDARGHLAGDEVLQEFCRRVRSVVEHDDLLARFGGEEFVLVLTERNLAAASAIAEQIRSASEHRPYATLVGEVAVTVSLGVCTYDGRQEASHDELIRYADELLYLAKNRGRNRYEGALWCPLAIGPPSQTLTAPHEIAWPSAANPQSGTRN